MFKHYLFVLSMVGALVGNNALAQENSTYVVLSNSTYQGAQHYIEQLASPINRIPHLAVSGDQVLSVIPESDLPALSEYIHHNERRCGGYFAFSTLDEANNFMQRSAYYAAQPFLLASYTIDNGTVVRNLMQQVSEANLRSTISRLEQFQNRWYQSSYGSQSNNWIRDTWASMASGRPDISVSLDNSCGNCGVQKNVVLKIAGTQQASEIVVIGAHQDSTISGINNESRAPGADDDASGVAVLTEMLRVIVASDFKPNRSIELMAYAAEEVGLRGSNAIANAYRNGNKNVVGVMQFDMTNYRPVNTASDVWVMTDNSDSALVLFLEQLFDVYLAPSGKTRGRSSCGYACSDHASWTQAGFPSAMYSEASLSQSNPAIHTVNDTLSAMGGTANHSVQFAQLGLAFAAEIAKGGQGGGSSSGGSSSGGSSSGGSSSGGSSSGGSSGGSCSSPQYVAGTAYSAGQLVQNVSNEYRCDIAGWCSSLAAWAYAPGTGSYWSSAWILNGACGASSSGGSSSGGSSSGGSSSGGSSGGGTCAGLATWNTTSVYTGGNQVQHNNVKYEAKWWTQGADPAQNSSQWAVWKNLGGC